MPVEANPAKSLFLGALEKPPADRAAYLDQACPDPDLRARVEELLKAHDESGSFPDFLAAGADATRSIDHTPDDPTRTGGISTDPAGPSLSFLGPPKVAGHLGRLDHYEVLSVLGQGGMGVVLKAQDESLDRVVAIKVLGNQYAANGTARKRFIREAKAVAAVSHENVVTVHAVDERVPYLVMQFVPGISLQDRLDRTGPPELREVLRIGMQIAAGLAAAHSQGIVHRDIKPSNILLENGIERVKITDFGLARAVDDASVTQSGVIAGTPMYMSPEQARGEAVDPRSDLFSLGSVLYALCTGRPPFRASGTMATLKRVIEDTPRPVRQVNAEVPDWLEAIVLKLLAKRPDERFQSAREVKELLERHLAHLQQPDRVPMPERVRPPRPAAPVNRRRRSTGGIIALVVALVLAVTCLPVLLIAGIWFFWSSGSGPAGPNPNLRPAPDGIETVTRPGPQEEKTLVVGLDDPDLRVAVQPENGEVQWGDGDPREPGFRLPPGRYQVRVVHKKRPDVLVYQQWVTIKAGERETLHAQSGWVQLFNGKDLTGWRAPATQPGNWRVDADGNLVGSGPSGVSHLFSDRGDFEDFHLRVAARVNFRGKKGVYFGNSGVFFRASGTPDRQGARFPTGYEAQIFAGETTANGAQREPNRTGSLYNLKVYERVVPGADAGEWFTMDVIARGSRFTIKVNGVTTVDDFEDKQFQRGHFALQQLGEETVVEFRRIEVKEFTGKGGPLTLTPPKVLEHMTGTWATEVTEQRGPGKPAAGKSAGLMTVEPVAGGQFYRIRNQSAGGGPSGLVIVTFDKDQWEFRNWYFAPTGFVSGTVAGKFDAATNTLTMSSLASEGVALLKQQKFIDADTTEWTVTSRDKTGTIVFESKGMARRQPGGGAIDESAAGPGPLPAEMAVLDRLAGTWDMAWAERSNPKDTRKAEMVGRKVLGGRFVEVRERVVPSGEENYFLYTFDPVNRAYCMWHFSSRWPMSESVGAWNAGAKVLTWTAETGPMTGSKMTWRFVSDDRTEFHMAVVGEGGKALADLEGTHTRRK